MIIRFDWSMVSSPGFHICPRTRLLFWASKSCVEAGKERRGIKAISHRTTVGKPNGRQNCR